MPTFGPVAIISVPVAAKRAELRERGVDVAEIDEQPYGRFATFEDVDGNGFVLMQPPDGAA